jgi:Predicted amidohydrolase
MRPFNSIYTHGFVRVAVCIPSLRVADPAYNVTRTIGLAERASVANAAVALFPELGLSAYTCDDLFQQDALLEGVLDALNRLIDASRSLTPVLLVGAPLRIDGALYNCAIVIYHGRILGVVPKSYIPNYREFYEKRQFSAARDALWQTITLAGATVPFGNDLIFVAGNVPGFALHAEIARCVVCAQSRRLAAHICICRSNITIGKATTADAVRRSIRHVYRRLPLLSRRSRRVDH